MSVLFDAGLLLVAILVFFLAVLGYFLVSNMFQSENRRGLLSKDGVTFVIAGVLFLVFTASYMEIFEFAFRLPYPAFVDLGIGLLAVLVSSAAAYRLAGVLSKRRARVR
ncbi:hypothetical protein [Roseibium sp. MMSF_3544]|uniref:hypothetical protein n=1 Tax=unclassified Roseibium TaxID=2629323 RepID=UPI00273DDCA4|nr:hypothetical protein [Roseibium sp. MMSF_3544]